MIQDQEDMDHLNTEDLINTLTEKYRLSQSVSKNSSDLMFMRNFYIQSLTFLDLNDSGHFYSRYGGPITGDVTILGSANNAFKVKNTNINKKVLSF